jgi:hypothetical protein
MQADELISMGLMHKCPADVSGSTAAGMVSGLLA